MGEWEGGKDVRGIRREGVWRGRKDESLFELMCRDQDRKRISCIMSCSPYPPPLTPPSSPSHLTLPSLPTNHVPLSEKVRCGLLGFMSGAVKASKLVLDYIWRYDMKVNNKSINYTHMLEKGFFNQ